MPDPPLPHDEPGERPAIRTPPHMYRQVFCLRINGDTIEETVCDVVGEVPYALFVNGRHMMTAMMSPRDLDDFVTGYLYTEQVIGSPHEIESVRVENNRISVITTNLFKVTGPKKTILSGCGGSVSYIDTGSLPKIHSDLVIGTTVIAGMVKQALSSELHRMTGGVHVVSLAGPEGIIRVAEDIGRHNALDRVIGYGLQNGIDFSRTFVIVSGRVSSEMVRKCLVANIPIIVSRGATTTLAIDIAQKNGVTIAGFVRGDRMNIYAHRKRIDTGGTASPRGSG